VSKAERPAHDGPYDDDYFQRYEKQGLLFRRGERPWLYWYWRRLLRAACSRLGASGQDANRRLLEVGCGGGYALVHWSRDFDAVGIDLAMSGLRSARDRLGAGAPLVLGSATWLPFRSSFFQAVVAFDILEHLDDPMPALKEIRRVLVSGGVLAITVPNPRSFGMRIKRRLWFGSRDTPSIQRDPTHVTILDWGQWQTLLEGCGFEIVHAGSDGLWDTPYFRLVPSLVQRFLFSYPSAIFGALFGFGRWELGENLVFMVRVKVTSA
jgi:SAM-dependent methyltransferase